MSIWVDISNISTFTGGVVGIIRAELEIAYNMAKISDQVRFCRLNQASDGIEEVSRADLGWLLSAATPVEGFLNHRSQKVSSSSIGDSSALPLPLKEFRSARSRGQHTKLAMQGLMSVLPLPLAKAVYYISRPFYLMFQGNSVPAKPVEKPSAARMPAIPDHPFSPGDVMFSCGWKDSNKEAIYGRVRESMDYRLHLSYLIYDTILINPKTKFLYGANSEAEFLKYFKWVATHCDLVFYGGNTARRDSQEIQRSLSLPVPAGQPVRFGDVPNASLQPLDQDATDALLESMGLEAGKYMLCVGSVEPRKNHGVLHRAYREMIEKPEAYGLDPSQPLPKLVVAGGLYGDVGLVHVFKEDDRVSPYVQFVRPSDEELDALYRNCRFTLMPTLYEGWNLTLPESLSFNKFCISSDVAPMREIGRDMIDYADPHEPSEWARLIARYTIDDQALAEREAYIGRTWRNKPWRATAQDIHDHLVQFDFPAHVNPPSSRLWLDLTLINNHYGSADGIPRVELGTAWELNRDPTSRVQFFETRRNGNDVEFVELTAVELPWLTRSRSDYPQAYHDHMAYKRHMIEQARRNQEAAWMVGNDLASQVFGPMMVAQPSRRSRIKTALLHMASLLPASTMAWLYRVVKGKSNDELAALASKGSAPATRPAPLPEIRTATGPTMPTDPQALSFERKPLRIVAHPFEAGDRVLSVGLDWESSYLQAISIIREETRIRTAYLVHDMIPLLEPHFYQPEIRKLYEIFFYWVCRTSDVVLFGGNTARKDGERLMARYHLESLPRTKGLRLGAEFEAEELAPREEDAEVLKRLGVEGDFLLSVGTIQIRKNHEVLYQALVKWLDDPEVDASTVPTLVFAGRQGWLVEGLMQQLRNDTRVARHLVLLQPTDEELRVLYRNCRFTLLPSFYEGAALPISESLAYGKFCLAADVPPLRETGGKFADYVDPRDVKGWRNAMENYYSHPELLAEREALIAGEKTHASWREFARDLVAELPAPAVTLSHHERDDSIKELH
ncbi:glycosyltransferase [Stenotrophomonas sp. SAU14A_NAIMI4_8]|uniref:glycosyltransferase n=1 Tax=Stenotrophomonas sp. SAU14A_NAIMI4_8 TaxID=2072409 RepID=UPI000D540392|nr:glycosyltransferase [Stenotrophomonas sp. SAU14A_NAIMI4_8]AWH31890.1 glycosyl transferase [Stenotrophomonas sp. SAU14A_NAIMI4_8]